MNPYSLYKRALETKWKWAIIGFTVFYFITPIDLFPELVLPIVGYIDDGVLLGILAHALLQRNKHEEDSESHTSGRVIEADQSNKTD